MGNFLFLIQQCYFHIDIALIDNNNIPIIIDNRDKTKIKYRYYRFPPKLFMPFYSFF